MTSGVYSRTLTLKSRDVDMFRRLRTAELFRLLQEASIAHTEELGMGRHMTLDKGLLWIVTHQKAEIARMPEYDETITVRSWPGETMHLLFPRYYDVLGEDGTPLIRASALWALLDEKERKIVNPAEHGVVVSAAEEDASLDLPGLPPILPEISRETFTVPFSCIDLNGHMNNARYFDLAENRIPAAAEGRRLTSVSAYYGTELRLRQKTVVTVGHEGDAWSVYGTAPEGGKPCFRLSFTYENK